jgi:hypothetical protein
MDLPDAEKAWLAACCRTWLDEADLAHRVMQDALGDGDLFRLRALAPKIYAFQRDRLQFVKA